MIRTGSLVLAVAFTAFFALTAGAADDISVSAHVDRTAVSVNQAVMFTVQVEGTMQNLPAPDVSRIGSDWNVHPSGTSSNMSWVNGRVSVSKSWNYSLVPRKTGTLTVGSVEVEFEGTVYRTDPITIDVVEGAAPQPGAIEERESSGVDPAGRDIFITTSVDKNSAYVGEQITLSFKFYRRVSLFEQPRYGAPDLTGFWVEDMGDVPEYYETANGIRYRVIEIRTALFGTAAGKATIGPASLTYQKEREGFSLFSIGGQPVTLTTKPIEVDIEPLPAEGRPADFGGAVGSYRMTASLDTRSVPELEPVTLTLKIEGRGNVRTVPEPELPDLPDFKTYESRSSTETTNDASIGGVKRYEYVLVPQSSGTRTIPSMSLTYFDPADGSYKTAATAPIELTVTQGTGEHSNEELPVRAAISRLGRDIRYIHEPEGSLTRVERPLHARASFLLLQLLPAVVLIGAVAYRRRRDRLAGDVGLARHVRAPTMARKELHEARALAERGDSAGVCTAVARALTDFIGNRWNVQARGMTTAEMESVLRGGGADDGLVERVRSILSACDLGRFAAFEDGVESERLLAEADECLRSLERLSARRRRR